MTITINLEQIKAWVIENQVLLVYCYIGLSILATIIGSRVAYRDIYYDPCDKVESTVASLATGLLVGIMWPTILLYPLYLAMTIGNTPRDRG